jgi:hypothetical protein
MKKSFSIFLSVVFISIFVSCSKEKVAVDPRDKFIGEWSGTITLTVPSANFTDTDDLTHTIKKDETNPNQIIIDNEQKAVVSGNTYTYIPFTETSTNPPGTISFTGTGTLSGTTLSESGTISGNISGVPITGTWSSSLTKK